VVLRPTIVMLSDWKMTEGHVSDEGIFNFSVNCSIFSVKAVKFQ
jgi:hypothetical protein